MRVVVKFHESAREDYLAWQARLSRAPTGNAGIASIHAEELTRALELLGGLPIGAKLKTELDPPVWEWRFSADTWIQFVVRERRSGIWVGPVREVIITAITNEVSG